MDSLKREKIFRRIDSYLKNENRLPRGIRVISKLFWKEIISPTEEIVNHDIEFDEVSSEWSALGFYLDSHPLESKKERGWEYVWFFVCLNFNPKNTQESQDV